MRVSCLSRRLALCFSVLAMIMAQGVGVTPAAGQSTESAWRDRTSEAKSVVGGISHYVQCGRCNGKGRLGSVCVLCDGSGRASGRTCNWCTGTGKAAVCNTCSGTGKIAVVRHVGSSSSTRRQLGWSVRRTQAASASVFDPFKVVPVSGYRRSDGVFVRPHKRSLPDTREFSRHTTRYRSDSLSTRRYGSPRQSYPGQPSPRYSAPSGSGGGRVYVRGYWRKDGTYVRPHTRSK